MVKNLLVLSLLVSFVSPGYSHEPSSPQAAPSERSAPPVLKGGEVPIGRLGHRLGDYLTLEGRRVDGRKTGDCTLLVDTVNGKKLTSPRGIWVRTIDGEPLPTKFRFQLKGYETILMIGSPPAWVAAVEELGGDAMLPQFGWHMHMEFIALSGFFIKDAVLVGDPLTALRSVYGKDTVLKLEENASPPGLSAGKGKAILVSSKDEDNEFHSTIYLMPADYRDGRKTPWMTRKSDEKPTTRLLVTTPTVKIYGQDTGDVDIIINALLKPSE